jgi:acyl-homoserine-lactone acylase
MKKQLSWHWLLLLAAISTILSGCSGQETESTAADGPISAAKKGEYDATVRWTGYGIPHVKAGDWGSLGYGFGYARARDAVCVLAEAVVTAKGERTRFFGRKGRNLDSDIFHKALLDQAAIDRSRENQPQQMVDMSNGFVAGYNRYLDDHMLELPKSCNKKPWVRPMTSDDMARISISVGIRYGLGNVMTAITNATPPNADTAGVFGSENTNDLPEIILPDVEQIGSNAYAIGKDLTENGRGILLGNPHYPWRGPSRFHIAHLTIPGELNVMGVGLYTTPMIVIGFNQHVAWSHTVSTARRFTVYELSLVEGNPLAYYYGDGQRNLEKRTVFVWAKGEDGKTELEEHTVYMSHYGPVMMSKDTPWTKKHAYAMRDVNFENNRSSEQYYRLSRAQSIQEVKAALGEVQGVSFVNTIAADVNGTAFYGDMSAIPNVTQALIDDCKSPNVESISGYPIIVLSGRSSRCEWGIDSAAAAPGVMPPSKLPQLVTDQYVTNSNDSYWLSNPDSRLEGFSPIIGNEGSARSLRTRAGLNFIAEVINSEPGKFTPDVVQSIMYNHRNYGAEVLLDDLLSLCAGSSPSAEVIGACWILKTWDRRQGLESRGAQIYAEFWQDAADIENLYAVPFDSRDPVNTPRGINIGDEVVKSQVMAALVSAISRLSDAGVPLDSRWKDVQFVEHNGDKIGIPGGSGRSGMFSNISAMLKKGAGYTPVVAGNSYIQVVTWDDDDNPDARVILTYSQSQEPESPHYSDQTRLYSEGGWIRLPFTEDQVAREIRETRRLTGAD